MTGNPNIHVTESTVFKVGRLGLSVAFGVCTLALFLLSWSAPELTPLFPVVLLGGVSFWYLLRNPLLHLCLVLGSFALVADFEEGVDIFEILFGLFYTSYLAIWLFRHLILHRRRLLETTTDRLVLLILVMVTIYAFVGWLWGAKVTNIFREWQSWTMLSFYFPVKEACKRHPKGIQAVLGVTILAALFVTVRNVAQLQSLVSAAAEVWQITKKGRVIANEIILVSGGLIALVAVIHFQRIRVVAVSFLLLVTFVLGLILTQSRGYWLGFAVGSLMIFWWSDRKGRTRILTVASLSVVMGLVTVFVLFGDFANLLFAGLLDRVLSFGSGTQDMSLVNRFLEISAAWESIRVNPILGYGLGSEFSYFDLTISGTRTWAFIHNGYVGLWYKFGLPGAILILVLWFKLIAIGVRLQRRADKASMSSRGSLIAVGILVSFVVSGMTANPFFLSDTLLVFGLSGGIVAAAAESSRRVD